MHWYQIVSLFGLYTQVYFVIIAWGLLLGFTTVEWTCGICGKTNHTGIVKALLCMCDHMGMF